MRRRDFIKGITGTAAAWPLGARAQKAAGKIQRIGIIDDSPSWNPFRQQLHELNYVEGQNLTYVYLRTDGSPDQLDAAAMALAQLPVNVIVAFGTPRAKAAQRATKTIPIVAISISDPVGSGLVTSLAHPAGNITGNTILGPDIVTKKLQILKDAIPAVARIDYLWNPENSATADILEDLRKAAPLFHMTLVSLAARTTVDFDRVLRSRAVAVGHPRWSQLSTRLLRPYRLLQRSLSGAVLRRRLMRSVADRTWYQRQWRILTQCSGPPLARLKPKDLEYWRKTWESNAGVYLIWKSSMPRTEKGSVVLRTAWSAMVWLHKAR